MLLAGDRLEFRRHDETGVLFLWLGFQGFDGLKHGLRRVMDESSKSLLQFEQHTNGAADSERAAR
jgi:hypothetical protein